MARTNKKRKRKHKQRGHWCWSCGRVLPNEKFSGKGHARHLCKQCASLGTEELAYRQALRDLERCLTWEGIIPRKRRKSFERFLEHDDERIRIEAEKMQFIDRHERQRMQWEAAGKYEELEEAAERWFDLEVTLSNGETWRPSEYL
jgi:hypothetical protein